MPSGLTPGEPVERDLRDELEDERAAKEHWRRVAQQRSSAYDSLRRQPAVRTLLALERWLAPFRRPLSGPVVRLRGLTDRLVLGVAALGHRSGAHLADVELTLARLPPPPAIGRRISLVVVGSWVPTVLADIDDAAVELVNVPPGRDAVAAVRGAIDASGGDLVGMLLATSEPVDGTWLARLAAAVTDDVVAATPVVMHPARPRAQATPHDGRVRSAGLSIDVTADGVPVVVAAGAGTVVEPDRPASEVAAASAACVLFDRAAYEKAGGLAITDDLDIALVELCTRLRSGGGRIVVEPTAVMIDHRPVRSRRQLRTPIDSDGVAWRAAIERSGPALFRSARRMAPGLLRFVITVAAPSAEGASWWGDWHVAEGLAAGLRRLGHEVRVQTFDHVDDPSGRVFDVRVVLRGLKPVRRSVGQRHVLWIISHPELIEDHELAAADLVLVASPRFADHVRSRVATPVEVLLQATDHRRFHPRPIDPDHQHAVTVVARTRAVLRPVVADALAVGLRPAIYGDGWGDLVDPELVVADHVENDELPIV
ncbi:MAG: hypothetical protein QOG30_1734, partial [Acidimicrobiaceae bacterium]